VLLRIYPPKQVDDELVLGGHVQPGAGADRQREQIAQLGHHPGIHPGHRREIDDDMRCPAELLADAASRQPTRRPSRVVGACNRTSR
jgi:hypothetical protein